MEILLIMLLIVIGLAVLLAVRSSIKTVQVAENAYTAARQPLDESEFALLVALELALPDTYRIFAKLRLSDIVVPSDMLSSKKQLAAQRHADQYSLTFTLCSQPQMKVIMVAECERSPETGVDSAYAHRILAANGIPVASFKVKNEYSLLEVWAKLSEACPNFISQPSVSAQSESELSQSPEQSSQATPESSSETESAPSPPVVTPQPEPLPAEPQVVHQEDTPPCSVCKGSMIRRKVVKGSHSGKFFLVCSNYPICKQMVALTDAAEPTVSAEQPRSSSSAGVANQASTPPEITTRTGVAYVVAGSASTSAKDADVQSVIPVQPIATTKPILLTAAVTAQPVSAMPSAVPVVEPQHEQSCSKCGKEMIRMQVAKGAHAGKYFWACSGYPTCRQLAAIKE
jgi:ssDNA-binding Zn-finger/Zn-ribbon topoisomerase 1